MATRYDHFGASISLQLRQFYQRVFTLTISLRKSLELRKLIAEITMITEIRVRLFCLVLGSKGQWLAKTKLDLGLLC